MKVSIDTDLDGLGKVLSELLGGKLTPTALRVTSTQLRIDAMVRVAFMTKSVVLTAAVQNAPGSMRIHGFALEGAMGFGPVALAELAAKIAKLDDRRGAFRAKGEADGQALVVTWT